MRINEILTESQLQQLDEGPIGSALGAVGRGIGKVAGGSSTMSGGNSIVSGGPGSSPTNGSVSNVSMVG